MVSTRINYDMLNYLPASMDTVKVRTNCLRISAKAHFSMIVVEDMGDKDVADLCKNRKRYIMLTQFFGIHR